MVMIKVGDKVTVYEDPITKGKHEGQARIIAIHQNHTYTVMFDDEPDEVYVRTIYEDGVSVRKVRKPVLVGETNPYGSDPYYALYPSPNGCSGHRLCHLILRMDNDEYLDTFERVNLGDGKWSLPLARQKAQTLLVPGARLILLGTKVCRAFGVDFEPITSRSVGLSGETVKILILPHPSGLNRLWRNQNVCVDAGRAVRDFIREEPDV